MAFDHDNGILGRVPGEFIAAASDGFPPPGDGAPAELVGEIDAGHVGRVRITYQLASHRHHKARMWRWQAVYAERVQQP